MRLSIAIALLHFALVGNEWFICDLMRDDADFSNRTLTEPEPPEPLLAFPGSRFRLLQEGFCFIDRVSSRYLVPCPVRDMIFDSID